MAPREELPDQILRDRVALDEASQKTLASKLLHMLGLFLTPDAPLAKKKRRHGSHQNEQSA